MHSTFPRFVVPIEGFKSRVGLECDIFRELLAPEVGVVVGVGTDEYQQAQDKR